MIFFLGWTLSKHLNEYSSSVLLNTISHLLLCAFWSHSSYYRQSEEWHNSWNSKLQQI